MFSFRASSPFKPRTPKDDTTLPHAHRLPKTAPVTTLRSKGLQSRFLANVLSRTTEGQSASVASKLALMTAVFRVVSGREEYDFADRAFLSMPMLSRQVSAFVRVGNLIEPEIESYFFDAISV